MHYRIDAKTVGAAEILSDHFVPAGFKVVVLWAVYAAIFAQLDLSLFHCNFDHRHDVVTLVWHQSCVLESLIIELNNKAIFVTAFKHTLNRREVVRPLTMILVPVKNNVLHEIQFQYALFIALADNENHKWEETSVFKLRYY